MNVALIGYGKMGKEIEKIALQRGHKISLIIDVNNPQDFSAEKMKNIDVAIEFTVPTMAVSNIKKCIDFGVPIVCGTTGWLADKHEVDTYCAQHNGCFFYASNYSLGVNLFFRLNKYLAHMMSRFDLYNPSIVEVHHTQKLDAPSGTAITLAEQILTSIERKTGWVNAHESSPSDLSILSVREDPAPGKHTITYESDVDLISICHDAKNRRGLALGAVVAAEFVVGKKGFYSMDDVLKDVL